MFENTQQLIARIGETDQLYLTDNTPELALERGDLRLQLVTCSNVKQEQIHFLQEALVLLETARMESEEMPMRLYIELSLHLAKAYMIYFELTGEQHHALITQQIMKPLTQNENGDIYFMLAYASISKGEIALTRHWLKKYLNSAEFNMQLLQEHHAFTAVRHEEWFMKMLQSRLH